MAAPFGAPLACPFTALGAAHVIYLSAAVDEEMQKLSQGAFVEYAPRRFRRTIDGGRVRYGQRKERTRALDRSTKILLHDDVKLSEGHRAAEEPRKQS